MQQLAVLGGEPVRRKPFRSYPVFDERELAALEAVLESGIWGGYNPKVKEFEETFADFHNARFGITAANGTVTLEAALLAAGVKEGDEVIVPPISFIATATAVLRVNAIPVFVDIDGSTFNISPERVEEAITERTRALIPVHFGGQPADMDALIAISKRHDLTIIEDCAHAPGATWKGESVGGLGDFGSFSFQASKNLTAGEGGFLTTNDEDLAEIARSICNQGRRTGGGWYEHVRLGTNYRLTGWQAAILLTQFSRLPEQNEKRSENAHFLGEKLRGIELLTLPVVDERVTCHSYYLYLLRLDLELLKGVSKDTFVKALAAEGVPCSPGYPNPLYANEVFNNYAHVRGNCPEAERMCSDTFWLSHEIMLSDTEGLKDTVLAIEKVASRAGDLATLEEMMSVRSM